MPFCPSEFRHFHRNQDVSIHSVNSTQVAWVETKHFQHNSNLVFRRLPPTMVQLYNSVSLVLLRKHLSAFWYPFLTNPNNVSMAHGEVCHLALNWCLAASVPSVTPIPNKKTCTENTSPGHLPQTCPETSNFMSSWPPE